MSSGPTSKALRAGEVDNPEHRGTKFVAQVPKAVALDVAENILLLEELADLLVEPPLRLTREDLNYPHDSIGDAELRGRIAALLSKTCNLVGEHSLSAENVLCTPGASAALLLHAKARLEPGDSVLVPAPYWQMFDRIYQHAGVTLIPLPIAIGASSTIDLPQLQETHAQLLAKGEHPRMLLLTNPHNPLGIVESGEALQSLFGWVLKHTEMEIVSDEIYAHSIYDASTAFVSAMAVDASLHYPERVHVIWGFAKDFGLSGWMAGVLLTRSAELHETITRQYARFSPFDGLKNRVLRRLLCERTKPAQQPEELLRLLPERLAAAQRLVASALREQKIPYARHAAGAPFFWLDLREFLDADLDRAPHPAACLLDGPELDGLDPREGRLQKYLACAGGVVLLRGQTMHSQEAGFFRLCFSGHASERIVQAVEQMGTALRALR